MYHSKYNLFTAKKHKAFTLVEMAAVLIIIAIISASVIEVMNRCISSTMDYKLRNYAFQLARDNMENLLNASSLSESAEFGISEVNPEVEWQTVVETFNEPIDSKMWLRARSSAFYQDSEGEMQTIEFTQWITPISQRDQQLIAEQNKREQEVLELYGLEEDYFEPDLPNKDPDILEPDIEQPDIEDPHTAQPDTESKDNSPCDYTEDELKNMSLEQVMKLFQMYMSGECG